METKERELVRGITDSSAGEQENKAGQSVSGEEERKDTDSPKM